MAPLVMNFSGIYRRQNFWKENFAEMDFSQIQGTGCYLDPEAEAEIRRKMEAYPVCGIHFIDSGNTHYLSKLWTDRIAENFSLIVFDHHSDMQTPAFDGILSCGSWLKAALDSNPFLQNVLLVGVGKSSAEEIPQAYRKKVQVVLESECSAESFGDDFVLAEKFFRYPVYISVDKDVLSERELKTNWDGGSLLTENFLKLLERIFAQGKVLGVDVCGEPSFYDVFSEDENLQQSNFINASLWNLLKNHF